MSDLSRYVLLHTERGECRCGKCLDRGDRPDPPGHTADLGFFKVAAREAPDRDTFLQLTRAHTFTYVECNPLDGRDHSYIELGAWIGDQGVAMLFMGLGELLGVFQLLTPAILGMESTDPLFKQMLEAGWLSIQAVPIKEACR